MNAEEKIEKAMALIKREPEVKRPEPEYFKHKYVDRDYHIRIYSANENFHDWSGSSFAGRSWSGAWAGGRER
jgi:hypothetical protein